MSGARKFAEPLKTVLIILLVISASALLYATWADDSIQGSASTLDVQPSRADAYGLASPPFSVVVREDGRAFASQIGRPDARLMLIRLAPLITDCLGAAEPPTVTSRAAFRAALLGDAVSVVFASRQPLRIVALAHGVDYDANNMWVDRIAITSGVGGVKVWFGDGDSFYSAGTSAAYTPMAEQLGAHATTGTFMFEQKGYAGSAAADVLFLDSPVLPTAVSLEQASPDASAYLALFGMNPQTQYRYTTRDGTQIALDDTKTLWVSPDGDITFSDTSPQMVEYDVAQSVERCRAIAAAIGQSGETEIVLESVTERGGETTVVFGYAINGVRVYDGGVLSFVLAGGIKESSITQRRYVTAETVQLMPYKTAFAVGAVGFAYFAETGDALVPRWVK